MLLKSFISTLALSIYLLILLPNVSSKNEFNSQKNTNFHPVHPSIGNQTNLQKFSIVVSLKDVEESVRKALRLKVNKNQHILNGNKKITKTKSHIKIAQLNKGKSNWDTNENLIKLELEEAESDIAIIGESNMLKNVPDIVAEILVEELNNILEKIAPSKVMQMRKENNPRDKETLRKKKECDQQLN